MVCGVWVQAANRLRLLTASMRLRDAMDIATSLAETGCQHSRKGRFSLLQLALSAVGVLHAEEGRNVLTQRLGASLGVPCSTTNRCTKKFGMPPVVGAFVCSASG